MREIHKCAPAQKEMEEKKERKEKVIRFTQRRLKNRIQRCAVVNRDVPANTCVLVETPLLLAQTNWGLVEAFLEKKPMSLVDLKKRFISSGSSLKRWDEEDAKHVETLKRRFPDVSVEDIKTVYDIACTNSLSVSRERSMCTRKFGLFRKFSLFNHACEPNGTMQTLDNTTGKTAFFTTRPVKAGDELTFAYADVPDSVSHENKQAYLEFEFGLKCECPTCQKP